MRPFGWLILAAFCVGLGCSGAVAQSCTQDDFAAAVDRSGAALRAFNGEALPKLRDKLKELKDAKGWTDPDYEEKGLSEIRDRRSTQFDAQAEDLILKIDTLGRPATDGPLDCSKLSELDAAGIELLAVMKAKSAYTLSRIDAVIAEGKAQGRNAAQPPTPKPEVAIAAPPPPSRKSELPKWRTRTQPPRTTPEPAPALQPLPQDAPQQGYTIDEIREITRGFFGTISTNLASVLEYAFSTSGRPDGYVLGTEGGGAFLAGVRYGKGKLYLRSGGTLDVYWHGPSIGTDFGAAGSRTMFLIYNLSEPSRLFRNFTGIDGSAYFVGGVGITFLKGGEVLMAPIRSGLGFRIGANLGYIRFTPHPTWNPF
jgi:hypothetical protein